MRTALVFAGPTALGSFAASSPHAPALAANFATANAHAPVVIAARAPKSVAEATAKTGEIPLPQANPFRLQSPAPIVASRPVRTQKLARTATKDEPQVATGFMQRLFGVNEPKQQAPLAYAPVETDDLRGWPSAAPPRRRGGEEKTAVYDISTKTVTLPNGQRLEAHSGLGDLMDDPGSKHIRNRGVTPPNIYTLRLRESLFHGVRAIRLIPESESRMFGRDGILAHSYMLGPRGDSNGCVSFRDYDAFLTAFLSGQVTRIVVIDNSASSLLTALNH